MADSDTKSPIDSLTSEQQERLAHLLDDYLSHRESDLPPDVKHILAANPDLDEALQLSFRSLDFLDRAASQLPGGGEQAVATAPRPEPAEKQLGDFVLAREIGRGGMGVVYEARQISLDRRVALKVLPFAAVLDQRQITRFENEARAAAQLHHPNIVPVFSVGCERGVHYYAMQYVEGGSLDLVLRQLRESDENSLRHQPVSTDDTTRTTVEPPPERSTLRAFTTAESTGGRDYYLAVCRLGIQAAEALHHAHDCGIVHRDVKPSNLLIDHAGKLWVTDFGLARIQAAEAGLTLTGQVLGSLRYMSPEQAAGNSNLLDQRSDVYSLGITLYEALTLQPAFEGEDRALLLTRITNDEPKAPRQIRSSIPADLETILLKAISKAPEQRYQTAQEFADDLRRFLEGKPTLAKRPTWLDRTGKWTRRHARLVATAACVAFLATIGLAVSTLLIAGAHHRAKIALEQSEANRARAEHNHVLAENHYRQAREAVDRFGAELAEKLAHVPGAEAVRAELLLDTLAYYKEFTEHAADDPELQQDLAFAYFKTGKIHEQIGQQEQALAEYEKALAAFQRLADNKAETRDYHAEMALCYNDMGLLLDATGKVPEASQALKKALAIQQQLVDATPDDSRALNDKALTLGNLGIIQRRAGNANEAEAHFTAAIQIQRQLAEQHPDELEYQSALAVTFNNLTIVYAKSDEQRAMQACEQALAIQERLTEAQPESIKYLSDLAVSYSNLGTLQGHSGHVAKAIMAYHQAVEIRRRLLRKAPSVIRFRSDLAVNCNNLGQLYQKSEQHEQALSCFDDAIELFEQLVSDYPEQLNHCSCLGGAQNNRAMALRRLGNKREAETAFRAAIEHQKFALDQAPSVADFRQFLSNHYANFSEFLLEQQRGNDAVEIAMARRLLWPDDPERLFSVAVELARAASTQPQQHGSEEAPPLEWTEAALETLQQAVRAGFSDTHRIREEAGFECLHEHSQFTTILDQIGAEPALPPTDNTSHLTIERTSQQAAS